MVGMEKYDAVGIFSNLLTKGNCISVPSEKRTSITAELRQQVMRGEIPLKQGKRLRDMRRRMGGPYEFCVTEALGPS